MKYEVLTMLNHADKYLSGETISKKLGVSRTAIWKHITSLRNEGYEILSVTNKGYLLKRDSIPLTNYQVLQNYNGDTKLYFFNELNSTNTKAKEMANEIIDDKALIYSRIQKQGRGRLGRNFHSNNLSGLWLSFVYKPAMNPEKATIFTLAASVAVCKLLKKECQMDARIKWPNDIIVNGKKLCGILTEMSCEMDKINYIVVGIGLNVAQLTFDDSIKDIATSLYLETEQKYDRGLLIGRLCYNMDNVYEQIINNKIPDIISEWKKYALPMGQKIVIYKGKEKINAKTITINDKGHLIVREENGEVNAYQSGEISIRGIMGYS
ncbi:MAG: biotin--[acetyl-CoA-carboxylase] ligase [Clostridiales bacterium]|nr:biotin--[acetyl-CoA-carboxylase] ligase [Clostridiales bacterium]